MEESQVPEKVTPSDEAPKTPKSSRKKNRNKKIIIIISVVAAVLLITGGGVLAYQLTRPSSDSNSNNNSTPENTAQEEVIQDGESTVTVTNTIPESFPKDISLYPGQTIISSSTIKSEGYTSWGVTAETTDDLAKTSAGLKSLFSGWQVVSESKVEGQDSVNYTKGDYNVTTYISFANGVTTINYSVTKFDPIVQEVVTEETTE